MLRLASRAEARVPLSAVSAALPAAAMGARRGARRLAVRHPAARPTALPGADEYREELRRRRRLWMAELKVAEEERAADAEARIARSRERREALERDREAYLAQAKQTISNFEEFGPSAAPAQPIRGATPLLRDIIAALDAEEARQAAEAPASAARPASADVADELGLAPASQDPVVAQRQRWWKRYLHLRRQFRFQNYLKTEADKSDKRLADLLSLFHASEHFVTRENIDRKIDAFLGEGVALPPVARNYRAETRFPHLKISDPLELARKLKEEARQRALEDALTGSVSMEVPLRSLSPSEIASSPPNSVGRVIRSVPDLGEVRKLAAKAEDDAPEAPPPGVGRKAADADGQAA
ncbi:hypothetical protein DFJ74DRAFT_687291 [Hyaloraphidium curvatum]|nr:hypothetical protein DFJ74DRAFT_687291 [Hyaloraphidium curvatum]